MLAPGLNDSFTEEGFWWLEGNKEKEVGGTLTFDPEAGPVLKLLGMLQDVVTSLNASLKATMVGCSPSMASRKRGSMSPSSELSIQTDS